MKRILPIVLLLTSAGALARAGDYGIIQGKVVYQTKPVAGAVVSFYAGRANGFAGNADLTAEPTKADGLFKISLPAGTWYLMARKSSGPEGDALPQGDYFSYYGGNPVFLGKGDDITVGINLGMIKNPDRKFLPGGPGIRGWVLSDGQPLDRARVVLYQDGETIFRGMGYASMLTTQGGEFLFNLEPGSYYVVARKRAGEDRFGPLSAGDLFAYAYNNPVQVEAGNYTIISLNATAKLAKDKERELTVGGTGKTGDTRVEGTVRHSSGRPAAGVYVSAYRDSMMTSKPDFISNKTGADGAYVLQLLNGGEFFIGARDTLGGPAERGDLLGRWAGREDHSITIRKGEVLKGIDIIVENVE